MMLFRQVKKSITCAVLGPAEDGRYRTIGYQNQTEDAESSLDNERSVQIYWVGSDFPESASALQGPFKHKITYRIDLSAAKATELDLKVLNDVSATPEDKADALYAFQEAAELADESFDELVDIVYQVIMDARNIDLGMSPGVVSDRWISQAKKDDPVPAGEYALLTGSMTLTCSVSEEAGGDPGVEGAINMSTVVDIVDDDVEKTGIDVTTT